MEYFSIGLIFLGVFLWMQALRHIKYMLTFYGLKYPVFIVFTALTYTIISPDKFLTAAEEFANSAFGLWFIWLCIRFALWAKNDPNVQRGWKNHNNLGAFNENWAPKGGQSKIFGGAAPPPARKGHVFNKKNDTVSADPVSKAEKGKTESVKTSRPNNDVKSDYQNRYSSSMKTCATCSMWGGLREIDKSKLVVRTIAPNSQGECMGGRHNRAQVQASGRCDMHNKYGVLK
jgi:hypothetical protein